MSDPTFEVRPDTVSPEGPVVVAAADPGMVGLTAANHLATDIGAEAVGYVAADGLPVTTPVADGEPRHHSRLYVGDEVTVLLTELFLPLPARRGFADAVVDWAADASELVVLAGVPFPHAPDDHDTFAVATSDYRERHSETMPTPLPGGLLDGVSGELLTAGLEGRAPPTAAFVTPAHPPGPDLDAAVLLLDALEAVYEVGVDSAELARISERIKTHYAELAERAREMEGSGPPDYPEDRAYM